MNKFALLVPTLRSEQQNLATLSYLAALSSPTLHVVISDCSTDPDKHAFLYQLKTYHPYLTVLCRDNKYPLYQDICNMLIYAKDYDYVAIAPDDDYASLSFYSKALEVLESNPDAVCSYGNYVIYQTSGYTFRDSRMATEATAEERIAAGFNPNYFNTMFFATFRRSAMEPWLNFVQNHPLISSFFDFLHCISIMVQGKVICHTAGNFLWTGENSDTSEANSKTRARYYIQSGLPEEFSLFHDLHFAVEGVSFLLGENSPLADRANQEKCAHIVWGRCMDRFRNDVERNTQLFQECLQQSEFAIVALNNLLSQTDCTDRKILNWFADILALFSTKKSKEYLAYHCHDFSI